MNVRAKILICWLATIAIGVATHFVPALPNILPGLVFLSSRYFISMRSPKLKTRAVILFLATNIAGALAVVTGVAEVGYRGSVVALAVATGLLGMAFLLVMLWSDLCVLRTGRSLA